MAFAIDVFPVPCAPVMPIFIIEVSIAQLNDYVYA
jgi:hypothetical protein